MLAVFVVNNAGDFVDMDPTVTTLREAIEEANLDDTDPVDEIIFAPSVFNTGTPQTIAIGSALPQITDSVTIDAEGQAVTIAAAVAGLEEAESIFFIRPSLSTGQTAQFTLRDLTLTGANFASGTPFVNSAVMFEPQGNGDPQLLIDNVEFFNNRSLRGAALLATGTGTIDIVSSRFDSNHSSGAGGAILVDGVGSTVTITDSEFTNNSAGIGGAISVQQFNGSYSPGVPNHYSALSSSFTLLGTRIIDNQADDVGGGVFIALGAGGQAEIRDSTISGNDAGLSLVTSQFENPNSGGGIYAYLFSGSSLDGVPNDGSHEASLTISGSTIDSNDAGVHGGGIFICAKREDNDFEVRSIAYLEGSTISGNTAAAASSNGEGGGMHVAVFEDLIGSPNDVEAIDVRLRHVTVTNNRATHGGGIYSFEPSQGPSATDNSEVDLSMENTIVSGNLNGDANPLPDNFHGSINSTLSQDGVDTRYNLVGSGSIFMDHDDRTLIATLVTLGPGNLDNSSNIPGLGPLLPNGGPTETHALLTTSPAIDAGDPSFDPELDNTPEFDQRGEDFLRLQGVSIDIGAYELLTADFDGDGDVDGFDFLLWQRGFGMTNATRLDGDADGDGDVDEDDLMLWSKQYGQGANNDINADFDDDGDVDMDDLNMWTTSYGVNGLGDADNDGDTDGLDFLAWQIKFLQENDMLSEVLNMVDTLQYLGEADQLVVSVTADEVDGDNSLGDLSLREAIVLANTATVPTTIVLPKGRYSLSRTGTEAGDASYNDLDVIGDVTIVGDGAGFSIIDSTNLTGSHGRALHLNTSTAKLRLDKLTIANGANAFNGQGVWVESGENLEIYDSAIVNHEGWAGGSGVAVTDANVTIRRSVFTHNDSTSPNPGATGAALTVYTATSGGASLTMSDTVFAFNAQASGSHHAVWAASHVTKTNDGYNLFDTVAGGFFDTTPGMGDHEGTPDYVVTSVADTFDNTDNDEALSLREAVHLANTNSGNDEIWVPAWDFVLTLDRATHGGGSTTDTDVAFGDIDIKETLTIRGVASGLTTIGWDAAATAEDEVFKLLGDFDGDGAVDQDLVSQYDYSLWSADNGSTGGYEDYRTDANEDGVVDNDDLQIWQDHLYNSFDPEDITIN